MAIEPGRAVRCTLGNYRNIQCDWCWKNVNIAGYFCMQGLVDKAFKNHPHKANINIGWGENIRPYTAQELKDDNVATDQGVGTRVDGSQAKIEAEAEKPVGLDSEKSKPGNDVEVGTTEETVGECFGG